MKTKRRRRIGHIDAMRMCVQSLIASVLTYACMKLIDSPAITWGVFSSLFTLQANFDRSLKHGVGQIIGSAAGTLVGLATLHLFPLAGDALPRLGIATLVTCLMSTLFPTTNYSIVVAAALALEPAAGVAGAVSRAEAIMLGAGIGIAVSVTVWPKLARSRAFDLMGDLLDDCRALLATIPILDPPKDRTSIDALHERFLRHLADAMAVSGETRVRARFAGGPTLGAALSAFETLWHGLVLLDRVGQSQCGWLREDERGVLSGRIDAVCGRADAYLESLSGWMRGGGPFPPAGGFLDPLHDASAAAGSILSRAAGKPDVPSQQLQALSMLKFALEQIESNLANIGAVLEARYRS